MATNKTNLFDKTLNGAYWDAGITFNRSNPVPIDKSSIYKTLEDAKTYASTSPVAYPGQIITVIAGEQEYSDWSFGDLTGYAVTSANGKLYINDVEAKLSDNQLSLKATVNKVEVTATRTVTKSLDVKPYQIIDTAGTLKPVGDNTATVELSTKLYGTAESNTDGDIGYLSTEIKEIQEVSLGNLSSYELSVWSTDSTEAGILKTYHLKQGDTRNFTIDIPKDFLVKSANLCSDANGKYIDFVINTLGNDGQETHLSIDVDDLVDEYFGGNTKEINITIGDTNTISAVINDNSIERSKVAESILSSLNAADAAEGKITAAINALDVGKVSGFIKSIEQVDGKISATAVTQIASSDIADIENFATKADIATLEGLTALNADTVNQIIQATQGLSNYTELTTFNYISNDHETRLTALKNTSDDLTSRVGTAESNIANITTTLNNVTSDYVKHDELDDAIAGVDVTDQLKTLSANTLTEANGYTDGKIADLNISQYAKTETVNGVSQKADDALAAAAKALTDANKHTDDAIAGLDIDQYAKTADVESTYATKTTVTTVSDDLDKVEEALSKTGISTLASNNGKVASTVDVENALTSANAYTNEAIANIGTPLRFVGVTTDENLAEGSEKADISGLNFDGEIRDGDVALNTVNGTEFVWYGKQWHIIGDQNNHATTTELKAEEAARKAADTVLASAIDNKLFYGNHNGSIISAESLSVVKISRADYHNLDTEKKNANNVVYIVNNDGAYSMYGETISELSTTGIEGTSEAANTKYVDTKIEAVKDEIPLSVSQLVWDITTISCGGADL